MDNIWDLLRSQPITNKLYELNKMYEEMEKTKAKALRDGEDSEIGGNEEDKAAYAVTLTREMKPTEDVHETEKSVMNTSFRVPKHINKSV